MDLSFYLLKSVRNSRAGSNRISKNISWTWSKQGRPTATLASRWHQVRCRLVPVTLGLECVCVCMYSHLIIQNFIFLRYYYFYYYCQFLLSTRISSLIFTHRRVTRKYCINLQITSKCQILNNSTKRTPTWKSNRFSLIKEFPSFYEIRDPSPCWRRPATWPYPEPDQSSPAPPNWSV